MTDAGYAERLADFWEDWRSAQPTYRRTVGELLDLARAAYEDREQTFRARVEQGDVPERMTGSQFAWMQSSHHQAGRGTHAHLA